MSWAQFITNHCAVCQIRLIRPPDVTTAQLLQVSKQIHSDLNKVCNVIYTRGQFSSMLPLDVTKFKGPVNPKLFLILVTGDLKQLYKLLFNIEGISRTIPVQEKQQLLHWNVSTKLFDTDIGQKDENLSHCLSELQNLRPSSIFKYLTWNKHDSSRLSNSIITYPNEQIPSYQSESWKFRFSTQKEGKRNHYSPNYTISPHMIYWEPRIFTSLYGLPTDMKLWLKDLQYHQGLDKIKNLNQTQKDDLDILLHGFKGL